MNRKLYLPILAIAVAILACGIPATPTSAPPPQISSTDTTIPTDTATSMPSPIPPTPTATGLTVDMLRNGTYYAPYFGRTVTLLNGSYSESSGANVYKVMMLDTVAFGDLNGDGVEDAAIILVENSGGTGQFESVIAVFNSYGAPIQADQAMLGDRVRVNSVTISMGVIRLDLLVPGPNDPLCCPSLAQKHSYWMIAGHLWLMRVTSTVGGNDHVVNIDSPANWADVSNPFTIKGNVPISPFENTLAYHVYLADGTKVSDSSLIVSSSGMGTPGTFSQDFNLNAAGVSGWIVVQFEEVSMADGSILARGSVVLNLP
jgi:hypothetical protein